MWLGFRVSMLCFCVAFLRRHHVPDVERSIHRWSQATSPECGLWSRRFGEFEVEQAATGDAKRSATCLTPRYSVAIVAVLAVDDSGRETHDSGRETEAARYYRLLDSAPTKATAPNTTATIPKISDVLMMRSPMG